MAMVALAPSDVNPDRIPNEDSSNLEFDDFNLFETNRFPGYDRIEGGQRVTYGLRGAIYGLDGGKVEAFLGQSVRHGDDDDFADGRSEEHTSELQSLMRISYAVFCLKKQKQHIQT